jgi:hypothetical protein
MPDNDDYSERVDKMNMQDEARWAENHRMWENRHKRWERYKAAYRAKIAQSKQSAKSDGDDMAAFDDTRDNVTLIEDTIIAGDAHADTRDDDDDCADEECESVWGVYF